MNEKVYKAINKEDETYYSLFIPKRIINDKLEGDCGFIKVENKYKTYSIGDSCSDNYNWYNQHTVVEATSLETEWYKLCTEAKKLVEQPKESFPIF